MKLFNIFAVATFFLYSECIVEGALRPSAVKAVFTQTGLNVASLSIENIVENNLKHVHFKKCDGEIPLLAGRIDYTIFDVTTVQFHKPTVSSKIFDSDGTLLITMMSESASVSGKWKYNYRFNFFQSSDSGSFTGLIENIEMKLKINVELTESSHFNLVSKFCDSSITGMKMNSVTTANWVYRYIMKDYKNISRESVTKMLCDEVQKIVTKEGNKKLDTFNYKANISQKLILQYNPVTEPTYHKYSVHFDLNGFFEEDNATDNVPNMTAPSGYMLGLAYSDAVFNSALRVMFKKHLLKTIYKSDNFKVLEKIATPPVFLENIKSIFVVIAATEVPTIHTNTTGMYCNAKISIQFLTRNLPNKQQEMVRFNMSTFMSFRLKVTNNHIKAKIEDMKYVMDEYKSNMGELDLDDKHYLIEQALKLFLQPHINDEFNKGIPLPGVDKVLYTDGLVKYEQNYVSFACDFSNATPTAKSK